MKRTRSIGAGALLAAALALALSGGASAATYYVSTAGSDSNPGTSASPFLTIQKGVGSVSAGDTVVVENGTYLYSGASGGNFITLSRSGTAASPIMLRAQNPGQVFLKGNNNLGNDGINIAASYWIIGGFDVSGFAGFCVNHSQNSAGTGIQLVGNNLHNCGNIGSSSSSYGVGGIFIGAGANTWTVNGNIIHDNGRASGLPNPNHDHGIYLDGDTNILISNNVFFNALYGWHIKIGVGSSSIYVYNNTFDGPAGSEYPTIEPGSVVLTDALSNLFVRNNIFYNPNADGILNLSTMSGSCAVDHNLVYNSAAGGLGVFSNGTPAGCVVANNLLNVNPLLAAPASFNFALLSGSPAIGAGVVLANVTLDFNGVSRATRNDLGAFQYAGGTTVTTALAISAVSVSGIGSNGATVNWTTNVLADGQVVYGPTSAYGSSTALNTTLTTSHSAALSGLTAGTVYHYAVKSHDSSGNLTTSPDATFTTAALAVAAAPAGCVSSAGAWQNLPLPAQSGFFTAEFDATPGTAVTDGVAGLSNGAASAYTSLAASVRFNNTGKIDARNDGSYAAAASIPYVAGMAYHFRLVVNIPTHTYSAYVKQGSNSELLIGGGYAFRTEQASVAQLSGLGAYADAGSVLVCNAAVTASAPPTVISGVTPSAIGPTTATIAWTTNNPADTQMQYGLTSSYGVTSTLNSTRVTSHSVSLGGLAAATLYHYRVMSRDAAGNLVTSPDATFTTTANTTPPVISGVSATAVGPASATIGWTTDKPSDSQVVYGPASTTVTVIAAGSIYTSATTINPTLTTSHSVPLSGLTASTLYHYAVKSRDSAGNLATSPDATFTTAASAPVPVASGCSTTSGGAWKNAALTSETGSFTAEFDAAPSAAKVDAVAGLSDGPAYAWSSVAAAVRFNNTGKIDARNGGAYAAAASIPYVAGLSYHFRLAVNIPTHRYSAYVKQGANAEVLVGSGFAFRTEQSSVALLNNLAAMADSGSLTVCNGTAHQ